MLVALPAGGRGGDKLEVGATVPQAAAAIGAKAGTHQAPAQVVAAVLAGDEGVAATSIETQAWPSHTAATAVAAGHRRGDNGCQRRENRVIDKSQREGSLVGMPPPRP